MKKLWANNVRRVTSDFILEGKATTASLTSAIPEHITHHHLRRPHPSNPFGNNHSSFLFWGVEIFFVNQLRFCFLRCVLPQLGIWGFIWLTINGLKLMGGRRSRNNHETQSGFHMVRKPSAMIYVKVGHLWKWNFFSSMWVCVRED